MSNLNDHIALRDEFELNIKDEKVRKPGLPILLPLALILWGSCAAIYTSSSSVDVEVLEVTISISIVVCLLLGFWLLVVKRKVFLGVLLSCALGMLLGLFGAWQTLFQAERAINTQEAEWTFELLDDATKSEFGSRASAIATSDTGVKCKVTLYFSEEVDLLATNKIKARGAAKSLKESSKQYSWNKGIGATISVDTFQRCENNLLTSFVASARASTINTIAAYCGEGAGIMQALVCGYRNTINDNGDYEKFKICGLAHVVAVSGAHLSIVISIFMLFLRKANVRRNWSVALSICFVIFYLIFAGIPISAIRSAIMVILTLFSSIAKRRSHPINALALTIVFFIVTDPVASISVSLFLSAASTLGIMVFSSLITSWMEIGNKKLNDWIAAPTALTISSNIATLPFSVALFSQLSTIAIFANIIATPLFSLACVISLIASIIALALQPLAPLVMTIASLCTSPLKIAVDTMSQIPYAAIAIKSDVILALAFSIILSTVLWFVWPKLKRRGLLIIGTAITAFTMAIILICPLFADDELVVLDVGQGDAILIRSGGKNVLVDTGNQETKLKEGLAQCGVYTLDAVIITHPDDDHMGVLSDMRGWMQVNSVYSAKGALECSCKNCMELKDAAIELKPLSKGDVLRIGNFEARVVWPGSYVDEGGNGDSVCLKLTIDCNKDGIAEMTTLLTGDAESKQLESIIDEGEVGDIDILKVGHHGSKVSLNDKTLTALRPEVALISCGKNNRYGHPKQETIDFLSKFNSKIYRTDTNGQISIKPNASGYAINAKN